MASQINNIVIGGNLTRDPELRSLPSGSSVCSLRIANNRRRKVRDEWTEVPGYFDVTVWGKQGENIAAYLTKGSGVLVRGELRWREWEASDGSKRQAVDINADEVQWLGGHDGKREPARTGRTDVPVEEEPPADFAYGGFAGQGGSAADDGDDIPF